MSEAIVMTRIVRQLSCGCCTNGCICHHHQNAPNGKPPVRCGLHPDSVPKQTFLQAMLEAAKNGNLTESVARDWLEGEDLDEVLAVIQ